MAALHMANPQTTVKSELNLLLKNFFCRHFQSYIFPLKENCSCIITAWPLRILGCSKAQNAFRVTAADYESGWVWGRSVSGCPWVLCNVLSVCTLFHIWLSTTSSLSFSPGTGWEALVTCEHTCSLKGPPASHRGGSLGPGRLSSRSRAEPVFKWLALQSFTYTLTSFVVYFYYIGRQLDAEKELSLRDGLCSGLNIGFATSWMFTLGK